MSSTICPLTQFTKDTGIVLAKPDGLGNTDEIQAWKGITREQIDILNTLVASKEGGDFHSWCIHKKSKKIYDDYSDPTTRLGSMVKDIMIFNNCDKIIYEEYEKTPKYLERLHATENEKCKNYSWFKDYKNAQDWSGNGYCFQRAHNKHNQSKNWKIKFGVVWIENSKTGKRYNLEGNFGEEIDDGLIIDNIQILQRKVYLGTVSKERAKQLICFFMSYGWEKVEECVDSWEIKGVKQYVAKRDVSRKQHARKKTKR